MTAHEDFMKACAQEIEIQANDPKVIQLSKEWLKISSKHKYSYHFSYLGRPAIQAPEDMAVYQEVLWKVKPDIVIETGVAHGGSVIQTASLLALLDYADAVYNNTQLNIHSPKRNVIAIDIDIREHNKKALEAHPLINYITLIEGSSIDPAVCSRVKNLIKPTDKVMVVLDSCHSHSHVLAELNFYAQYVTTGSYCIVHDTAIEYNADFFCTDRPWCKGNNPKTAVDQFLVNHPEFIADNDIEKKVLCTSAPGGWLIKTS